MVEGFYPVNLEEAVQLKSDYPEANLYSGGTDWMVRHEPCEKMIFINQVQELQIIAEREEELFIGSGCTFDYLLKHMSVPQILKDAIRGIASPSIRNAGTIGGNICNASPAGDTLPVLYALDAKLKLVSKDQERIVSIEDFILGVRRLSIKATEILTGIIIPKQNFTKIAYEKVGARKAQALSKLSFVGLADIKEGKITGLRIAFGSVGTTVVRRKEIEQEYLGKQTSEIEGLIAEMIEKYNFVLHPIDDQRSTAVYRKKVCLNLLEEFLRSL